MQKRPLSAYMHFSQDMRAVVKEENPDAAFGALPSSLSARPQFVATRSCGRDGTR